MTYSPYAPPRDRLPTAPVPYRPLAWRSTGAALAIGGSVVLGFVTAGLTAAIGQPSPDKLAAYVVLMLVSLVTMAASTLAWVLFLVWMYEAAKNARAFGREGLKFTPGWCVAWWFIPIASLWKPYQALREIWRASDPASLGRGGEWAAGDVPAALPTWWATWILSGFVGVAGVVSSFIANVAHEPPHAGYAVELASSLLGALAAVFVIVIIRRLDARQSACAEALGLAPGSAGAPHGRYPS